MDLHPEFLQYAITTNRDLHHVHHVVHMCEKRLRLLDAADARNPYPTDPNRGPGGDHPYDLHIHDWKPSEEELLEHYGKKSFIHENRQRTVLKLNQALALLRRATHPDLLRDEIFQNFDVDHLWTLRKTPPPEITRQPGIFEPAPAEGRGPPAGAGRVAPPKPDKVELMNAHYAEQQSLLLAHPQAQPGPYAA